FYAILSLIAQWRIESSSKYGCNGNFGGVKSDAAAAVTLISEPDRSRSGLKQRGHSGFNDDSCLRRKLRVGG
ncbi:MAG TPA: hypothetical protein VF898_04780, partial [Chloroflexota bacterium]